MPIIVFGALRSGTTLLRLMLNAHPEINNPGEVDFLTDHIRRDPGAPTGWRYDLATLQADRMFRAQNIEIAPALDGLHLLDALLRRLDAKSPGLLCVNMHRDLPVALQLFPGARVIHLLRDPRDVARSSVEMGWAGTLYHGADHWLKTEHDWDRARACLTPDAWTEARYEDLMTNPREELARLCDFAGLAYSEKMMGYPAHSTYALPDPSLCLQWKRRCGEREVAELESKLGNMLQARGYAASQDHRQLGYARKLRLAVKNKVGIWTFGIRHYGIIPFAGVRLAHRLRARGLERYFQKRIDARIRQMLR